MVVGGSVLYLYNKSDYADNTIPTELESGVLVSMADQKVKRRVVVTGGAGFIGSHLVDRLVKRDEEVVVLESVRQGYHTLGAIVWTTFLDKIDAETALRKLLEKGLLIQNEKREGFSKIPIYDLAANVAEKIGKEKKGLFGITRKTLPKPIKNLKELSHAIQSVKEAIEDNNAEKTIEVFDEFIDPTKSGEQMIENFFEQHREIGLWKIRLKDRGDDYIVENKEKMLLLFENIEVTITKKLRNEIS